MPFQACLKTRCGHDKKYSDPYFLWTSGLEKALWPRFPAPTLPRGIHLWVLRQRGVNAGVKEGDIMAPLRAHGLAPSKAAAWSEFYAADRCGRARGDR